MIRAIAFLFITLVAGSAEAAVVTVKSGEHPDFSRLVLFLPRGADWQLEEAERAVTISLPDGAPHRFDLSGVFDLIPRDRIADLSQADGHRLRVVLNCACPVTASFEAPRYLILDVGDPAEVGDPAAPGPVPTPPPASGSSPELEARLRAELTEGQVSSSRSVTRMAEALAERATRNILEIGDPGPPRTGSEPAPEVVLRNADLPNLALPEIDAENSAGSASHRSPARCDGPVGNRDQEYR